MNENWTQVVEKRRNNFQFFWFKKHKTRSTTNKKKQRSTTVWLGLCVVCVRDRGLVTFMNLFWLSRQALVVWRWWWRRKWVYICRVGKKDENRPYLGRELLLEFYPVGRLPPYCIRHPNKIFVLTHTIRHHYWFFFIWIWNGNENEIESKVNCSFRCDGH